MNHIKLNHMKLKLRHLVLQDTQYNSWHFIVH
jgi:hypothetical protein